MAAQAASDVRVLRNFVGGEWIDAEATEASEVRNPATDEVLAHVPLGG